MKTTQNNDSQVDVMLHPDKKLNSKDVAEYLRDYVPAEFPTNSLRVPNLPGDVDVHRFYLAKETYAALELFAKDLSISPALALVAAVRILHFRYSGINQAAVGLCTVFPNPGIEGEMTQSHSTFLVCLPVDGDETLGKVVENTGQAIATASQYSQFPFLDAVAKLGSSQSNACDHVVPILVALEDGRSSSDSVSAPEARAHIDMEWRFRRVGDKFGCDVIYNRALFKAERIHALATNIADVIECIPLNSGLTVEEIPFSHALQQLIEAQLPVYPPPRPQEPRGSLAEAFKLAAARHADKSALVDGRLLFTYREIDVLSSALAKRISDITQGQDTYELVSLCIPSSALTIVVILGIVKYGAAYVPLDVRFPGERLETLLNDSGARLLVTSSQSPEFHIQKSRVTRLDISDFLTDWRSLIAAWDGANLPSCPKRTDLAYILYISSSTGRPNGVPIKQSSVLACVSNRDMIPFGPDYRVAQINNLARDASVIEIWCTLLSGATLVCFTSYDVLDPPTLARQFDLFKINCCFMTTALFRQHLDLAPNLFRSLHTLLVGGESVYYESFHKVRTVNPSIIIRNVYGTTETCAMSAAFSILDSDEMPEFGLVPVGRPFRTSQKLVIDTQGRLVPPGVIGELFIGGEGVSCGYLNRPTETSCVFVEMEVKGLSQPRSRFYRTGDIVKWCDGQLQFVGRLVAGQVKICGQRMELAEVEATIIHTGLAKRAAVTHYKPADGRDPFLVAYIVTDPKLHSVVSDSVACEGQASRTTASSKVVETWRELYDDPSSFVDINEARSKFLGWDSMITGLPIPQDEMNAWLHDTLRPFFQRRPRTVFEVGCGIGIFLYEMAPFVEHVWAIEPSGEAVDQLNAQLRANNTAEKFSIWNVPADRISELPPFQSDFVLINSATQYLPSEAYLREVLLQIVDKCAPGSQILIGDVRSFPLDNLLGINVVLHEWRDNLDTHTIQDLRDRIINRNQNRVDLLVNPTFFFNLQRLSTAIVHVEIVPKVMEKSNELSQFRYQVVLHLHQNMTMIVPETWHHYEDLGWDSASLEDALRVFVAGEERVLAVECVPNKFLCWERAAASVVFSPTSNALASLATLPPPPPPPAISAGWSAWDIERLAERFGVSVRLSLARQSQSTAFDVVFIKTQTVDVQYVTFKTVDYKDTMVPDFSIRLLEQLNAKYSTHPERDVLKRLRICLPTYMIPEAIYSRPSLPLLPSGKLDRPRVAAMAGVDTGRGFDIKGMTAFAQPKDTLEMRVCEVFGQILSSGTVSPISDFFSIGGNYLLATRLKTAIESEFGIRFALATVFARPTPRDVASKIRALSPSANLSRIAPITAPSPGTYLPLSFAQDRLLFLARLTGPEDTSYHCPYVLSLSGNLRVDALERTIHEMASRHEVWRTIFVEVDGVPKTQVLDIVPRLETVLVQPGTSSDGVQGLVKKHAMRPFLLDSEPAFRPTLFKISPSQSVLLLSIHHIVWDGFSQDVCRNELAEIYSSFSLGRDHSLPPLDIQYREFTEWQRSDDFETLLRPQIDYWKTHLLGSRPAEFPIDFPRPQQLSRQARTHVVYCRLGLRERLQTVCQKEHVTIFMWLLTVFRAVHYQLTGQEDASLGYPIANRNRHETEKLIGFFANTQIFRLKVHSGVTFLDLLQQTQALSITAFENQDIPFERIVSILNPDRDAARNPLVQIMFTYETIKTAPFSFGGIEASESPLDMKTSRLDLEVYFRTREGRLQAAFIYRTDLFKESTIIGLAEGIQQMLERTLQDPHVSIHLARQGPADTVQPRFHNLRKYLHGYTPAELPLDYIRTAAALSESQVHHFYLPKEACAALKLLTIWGAKDVSLPLIAAFRILQFRYSCNENAAIGSRTADTSALSQNPVVVRIPVSGGATLSSILEDTRHAVTTASKYPEMPSLDVIVDPQPKKSSAWDSVVRIVIVLEQIGNSEGNDALAEERACFDMEWRFCSVADEIRCDLIYNRTLFKAESIKRFSSNFIDVVKCILREPGLTVEEVPFSHALQQLIEAQLPIYPPPQPQEPRGDLTEAFKLAAARHADRSALVDGRLLFTYREINIVSSALAKRISDITEGQDTYEFVSFCLPPSALAIIAILGIVKYGAAYVPLDVRFSSERLEALLDDSGARLLITSSQSPELGIKKSNVTHLDISDFLTDWRSLVAAWETKTLPSYPKQTDLAYVMYTSGSTGRPKGVPIKQSSVLAMVSNRGTFRFGPDYRVAQINNLAWDPSVIDVWCTLLSGAALVCFNRYDVLDPPALAQQFALFKIQCCIMSPALFRQVLDLAPHLFCSLNHLILGGESIYYESLQKLRAINPSIILQNMYGPTEGCVVTTTFSIYSDDAMPESGLVPIGRPLDTVQALVVDTRGRLVPPGVTGELIIGGEGISYGYLNCAAETSLSFGVMELEGLNQSHSTFYHSGDVAKWRSDCQLQFVGRLNIGQVKIRGQRFELAEVEAAIVRTGLVNDAAVVYYKPEDGGDPYLVAYVVESSEEAPFCGKLPCGQADASEEARPLQGKLLDRLRISVPSFMVPPTIRSVSSLPLLPNGKLDRIWLYSQTAADAASLRKLDQNRSFEAPYDDTEERLCTILEEVLGRSPIYRSSDFFANGGHSLLALRLSLRIQHAFNIAFTVLDVFKLSNPKAMADKIRASTLAPDVGASLDTPWLFSQDPIPSGTTSEDGDIPPLLVFSQKPNNPYIFCIPMATGIGSKFEALSQVASRLNVIAFNDPRHCGPSLKASFEGGNSVPRQAIYYYECIVQRIRDLCGGKEMAPLNIMGYSFGGHLAIEVARMAQRDGWGANLFVVDSSHPKGWYAGGGSITLDAVLDTVDLRQSGDKRGQLQDTIRPVTAANLRALTVHTLSLYPGHVTLFRSEDNVDHGFAPVVGSLDEIVLQGDHFLLLDEPMGNLSAIAEKVCEVIGGSASGRG